MKSSQTKIRELKELLDLEKVSPDVFIQFVFDAVDSMPDRWQDACRRYYLEGGKQRIDPETGKAAQTDSRYYIMQEHARYGMRMLVNLAKDHPETLNWLMREVNG